MNPTSATWTGRQTAAAGLLGVLLVLMFVLAPASPAQGATGPVTWDFACTGAEQTFTVPNTVTSVHIVAVGAPGGSTGAASGGLGAQVSGDLSVTPGEALFVEVGCPGSDRVGGFNGGGDGASTTVNAPGGGGGASDVRTLSSMFAGSLNFRLVVAAGGGGVGATASNGGAPGAAGGNAGAGGGGASFGGGGGKAATSSAGGGGGTAGSGGGSAGGPGSPGIGGTGGNENGGAGGGGGGGGGRFGGGGGGGGGVVNSKAWGGGGGGGGSSLVPSGGSARTAAAGTPPSVQISYQVPASPGPFVYLSDAIGNDVAQFDASSGSLAPISPATIGSVTNPGSGAASPDGHSLYIVSQNQGQISQYNINADGELTPKAPDTVSAAGLVGSIAVTPDGHHAFATIAGVQSKLELYDIESDGTLRSKSPATVLVGGNAAGVLASPDGHSLYVANRTDPVSGMNAGSISQFTINADGTLTPKSPATVPAGQQPYRLAISPNGKSLYSSDIGGGGIYEFDIQMDGTLHPKPTASVSAAAVNIALTPDGNSLYAASDLGIAQFTVGPGGELAPKQPASVPGAPSANDIVVNSDGTRVYVSSGSGLGPGSIYQYGVAGDGTLVARSPASIPVGTASGALTITPSASPSARISQPASGGSYAQGAQVPTSFSCNEGAGGLGLQSCDDSAGTNTATGGTGHLDTSTLGSHTYTVTAVSKSLRTATASITYDVTAAAPNPAGSNPAGLTPGGSNPGDSNPSGSNPSGSNRGGWSPQIAIATGRASVRRGRTRISLRCAGAVVCQGTLSLTVRQRVARHRGKMRYKTIVLGRITYRVSGGRTTQVGLRLSTAAINVLKRTRQHRSSVHLIATLIGGRSAVRNIVLQLRR